MLKPLSTVALLISVSLWHANSLPLCAQVPQPPTAAELLLPSTTLRPKVTLGIPVVKGPQPLVSLGLPTESRPQPRVMLGLPEPLESSRKSVPLVTFGSLPANDGQRSSRPDVRLELPSASVDFSLPQVNSSDAKHPSLSSPAKLTLGSEHRDRPAEEVPPPQFHPSLVKNLPSTPTVSPNSPTQLASVQAEDAELESPTPTLKPSQTFNPLDALPPSMLEQGGTNADTLHTNPTSSPDVKPQGPTELNTGGSTALAPRSSGSDVLSVDNRFATPAEAESAKKTSGPYFFGVAGSNQPPSHDEQAWQTPYSDQAFSPQPISGIPSGPQFEASPYRGKFAVPTQRPWVELWRPLYTGGTYPPAQEWLGRYNLVMPHFMVYGDYRSGLAINRNANGDFNNWASRLNLDMDLEITATERLHAFMGPLDRNGDYTRLDFTDQVEFVNRTDMRLDNLFFEGDAGAIWGGFTDQDAPFDLPFSFGFLPLFYQNGIWANDNVIGAAVALPSKNSPLLKWTNYDATFFWGSDQINSDAFLGDNNAAEFFGSAWFIEAYDGYIEADYAFVHDDVGGQRSYHNLSMAYTRRYFMRVSNSIRYITNFGQSLPSDERTADGHMLLLENSLISKAPNTLVPYLNMFYGQGRTQSLARANNAGGVLNNTGINFETDGLTGYPTLDATGVNATGAALGVNMLGADFQHQLIMEVAALSANGQANLRNAPGDQYAVGMRYQKPLSNAWIFRTDHMVGWRENARELRGSRVELRWKF